MKRHLVTERLTGLNLQRVVLVKNLVIRRAGVRVLIIHDADDFDRRQNILPVTDRHLFGDKSRTIVEQPIPLV